jgi:magnesium-transporting ATPase (P-type)
MVYYNNPTEKVLQSLNTSTSGLTEEEVINRRDKCGLNRMPKHKKAGLLKIFLAQFLNPLIYVLLIASAVTVLLHEYTDAIFIGVVLLLNAVIGTVQEFKAEKSAAALQQMIKVMAKVRRGGSVVNIDSEELVPGDIVFLESGNRVPADVRLIEVNDLKVDEAFLTGESEGVIKSTGPLEGELVVGDRKNMAYAGSTILYGRGVGAVTATGLYTEMGKIAGTLETTVSFKPPLVIRMEKFARQVAYIIMVVVVVLGIVAALQGMPLHDIFFLSVALAVSAIPEGLPVAITVALSISTSRMAKKNVIVRKLSAVEGLGSCTMIASDKTGTLTMNSQTVRKVILVSGQKIDVSGEGYNDSGEIVPYEGADIAPLQKELEAFVTASVLCNESDLTNKNGEWHTSGDSVDIAFLSLAYKNGMNPSEIRSGHKILAELPFESERKFAATFYEEEGKVFVAVKGAQETLLPLCVCSKERRDDPAMREQIEKDAVYLTSDGYRVIAVATGEVKRAEKYNDDSITDLHLIGLAGLKDPLRAEAYESVRNCLRAGVQVSMVTGDHPLTALSIAKDLGIAESMDNVITGVEVQDLTEGEYSALASVIGDKTVFARVSPLQKMKIIEALSENGHLVAVTGDGVNDVPALKKANIGIAMGSGTDLAKETAEIIITDDNFKSIEEGIEGGRHAYDNIRKVTYLLISTGAAEILLFLLSLFTGQPLPLTAIQLLWLNLVTNGIQDVALAFEGPEKDLMKRKPRDPKEGIFNRQMIQQTLLSGAIMGLMAFGLFSWALNSLGFSELHSRSLAFTLMVLLENVHVFNCRSEQNSVFKVPLSRNWFIIGGVILAQLVHITAINLPFMQNILGTDTISFGEWWYILGYALILLVAMEIFKIVKRRRGSEGQ